MNEAVQNNACPECGAPLAPGQARCWLCRRSEHDPAPANPYAAPQPLATDNLPLQFSMASLMLVVTLVAVTLGAFWVAPGLGVFLVILGVPALIRTVIAANRQQRVGGTYSIGEKIGVFLLSLLIMWAVWMSASIAFAIVCTVGFAPIAMADGDMNVALLIGVLGGLVSAIALAAWLLRLTAPRPTPRQTDR